MQSEKERQADQEAYRRLKETIKQNYPADRFVAIFGEQIVADAQSFIDIQSALIAMGNDPRDVLIVQAGVDYPEHLIIFFHP